MRYWILLALALGASQAARAAAPPARYLVSFIPGTDAARREKVLKSLGAAPVEAIDGLDALVAEVPSGAASVAAFENAAALDPFVDMIEEDRYLIWINAAEAAPAWPDWTAVKDLVKPFASAVMPPLPPGVDAAEVPWGIQRVNAPAAWTKTMGEGVKVAVVDTGIDAAHPDLRGQVAGGYNAFDSKASTFDDNGHGTHVSGTIAGIRDSKGVVGVAPKARLFAVKVLDKDGGGRLSSVVKGIVWCGKNGIQVANMSLGAPMGSIFMHLAVIYAHSKGVAIVAAAGNSGGRVGYPAGYKDAIAVAALDSRDQIASFSSRGSKVEFIAPGVGVRSSVPGGGYDSYSGTSMATPHMTGLAALALARGARGPDGVRSALKRAARTVGLKPEEQGAGVVDAALLVQ